MSDTDVEAKTPESAILKTIRLLRFTPFSASTESKSKSPSSPIAQDEPQEEPPTPEPPSPPPEPTRTPMGCYIVPPGGKPLSSLGYPVPGPADYMPKTDLTRNSPPSYSLVGRAKKIPPKTYPGPADYMCGKDLIWKERTITLKAKAGKSYKAAVATSDIGPAKYDTAQPIGDGGPRYSIASKHTPIDVIAGPPNKRVEPVDTHGFETPGPNYRPNSGYWSRGPKKSFGSGRRVVFEGDADKPGPGDYDVPETEKGPSYSLTKRLSNADETTRRKKKNDPAPNSYDVGSTIGKAVAISITGRRKEYNPMRIVPSPNTYTLKPALNPNYKAATMSYRWFERKAPSEPGPSDYSVRHVTLKKNPEFTCRRRCKPSYPDSINYVTKSSPTTSPGPGKYNISSNIRNNDYPAYSVGLPARGHVEEGGPAPNQYAVEKFQKPGAARAPAFTMGRRLESRGSKVSPGPAAYNLQTPEASGPKYTMSKRLRRAVKSSKFPAPNAYVLLSCQTNRGTKKNLGIKLKSRASPYIYNGFQTNNIAEPVAS